LEFDSGARWVNIFVIYGGDNMQFGFWLGKGTSDVIFTVRQVHEKYGNKGRKLYFVYVQKMFARVMAMYEGAQVAVRIVTTVKRNRKAFDVRIWLQQAFVLSPLLFVIVMRYSPWKLVYVEDLILMAETEY